MIFIDEDSPAGRAKSERSRRSPVRRTAVRHRAPVAASASTKTASDSVRLQQMQRVRRHINFPARDIISFAWASGMQLMRRRQVTRRVERPMRKSIATFTYWSRGSRDRPHRNSNRWWRRCSGRRTAGVRPVCQHDRTCRFGAGVRSADVGKRVRCQRGGDIASCLASESAQRSTATEQLPESTPRW